MLTRVAGLSVNMAEDDSLQSQTEDSEPVVNRWILDYYIFRALQCFERSQYQEFCSVKLLLDQLLTRPVENSGSIPTKIQVLQFLSWINNQDNDVVFEQVTSLESALLVLEDMKNVCNIPQQDFKKVSTSIKELIVGISIKSNKFDQAKEMLQKHFPQPVIGKKAIFMGLIKQKRRNHEVIEQINFQQFKEEMVAFCQSLVASCYFGIPFLCKAAKELIDRRSMEQDSRAAGAEEHDRLSSSSSQQQSTGQVAARHCSVIQRVRLEAAYTALAVGTDQKTFAQLENEVEMERQDREFCLKLSPESQRQGNVDLEPDGLFQRDSGSPMEASPADQTEQTDVVPETQVGSKTPPVLRSRKCFSIARLVVEPDSQPSSHATVASQQKQTEVRGENPAPPLTASRTESPPCTEQDSNVAINTRNSLQSQSRRNRRANRASTSRSTKSPDREEDSLDSKDNREAQSGSPTGLEEQSSADGEKQQQEAEASSKRSQKKHGKRPARTPPSNDGSTADDLHISDSSLDGSSSIVPPSDPVPQSSSTPHKNQEPSRSKWKTLLDNAIESKETWDEEDTPFTSKNKRQNESTLNNSGNKRKKWTDSETKKLKEGVKKFGEGNWSKIKSYYSFHDRTNVNLKDRWRTLQKQKGGLS
ncbi:telomeric repeat binding factor a [Salarias fasciatus]|uniref:telomeric repeat binding factor a n=1 Tax=Salarias fasciatus TaxID=181472 RepID=UPI0011766A2D|nr:telomeric repeat-binding factor 2-like [Salarias fasciatus]